MRYEYYFFIKTQSLSLINTISALHRFVMVVNISQGTAKPMFLSGTFLLSLDNNYY